MTYPQPGERPGGDVPASIPEASSIPGAVQIAGVPAPRSAADAVAMALASLQWLATANLASMPAVVQADGLRGLERVLSVHTAARANVLAGFCAQVGYENDGHGSPRTWLSWQTRVTKAAAWAAVASMRRLAAHPAVAAALRDATISVSWARQICEWTDLLPAEHRADADAILLAAAGAGADLAGLASLAEEMRRRLATPDRDPDGFADRHLRLDTTLGGAGKLWGDLTPQCAAALRAVLDSLGKKAGPEDSRTAGQRDHDALEEACRRLIAAGGLPDRAGQPSRIQLTMTLSELANGVVGDGNPLALLGIHGPAGQPGQPGLEPGQPGLEPAQSGQPGQPGFEPAQSGQSGQSGILPARPVGAAVGPGYDCDASIAPVVTGQIDYDLLDRLAALLAGRAGELATGAAAAGRAAARPTWVAASRQHLLAAAVGLLSGTGGLASMLRTGALNGPAASRSLPLDLGAPTETIPPHLRRAVILRDQQCGFPGCDIAPGGCQVHHVKPRSKGGLTKLSNLLLLCTFHHLIAVHRWGWVVALNGDGTTTATSPDGRVFHSHSPPQVAVA